MLTAIKILFFAFFDVCRLRKGPQDIPASYHLFGLCLTVNILFSFLLLNLFLSLLPAISATLLKTAVLLTYVWFFLWASSMPGRWLQTVTALVGTGIILSLLTLSLYLFDGIKTEPGEWLFLLLIGWDILITGHILRHAMLVRLWLAIVLSIMYVIIVFNLIRIFIL